MFYYTLSTLVSYRLLLIAAAILPAVFLMVKAYRSDRLEKESPALLWNLMKTGILSALLALVSERLLSFVLDLTVPQSGGLYSVLLYFVVVAFSEEGAKYLLLKKRTWNSPEFNCQYDGVVYAVFVSLGFALWENISYVLHYGLQTAVLRALTAIPGHACFGVFMGIFYGLAKRYARGGKQKKATLLQLLAFLVPAALHGAYDYIASADAGVWYFVGFVAVLFVMSYVLVGKSSRNDRYL